MPEQKRKPVKLRFEKSNMEGTILADVNNALLQVHVQGWTHRATALAIMEAVNKVAPQREGGQVFILESA